MKVRKLNLVVLVLFINFKISAAHPTPPPPQPASIPPPVGTEAPIDSNLSVLFLIGTALGLFVISQRINQKE